MKSKMSIPAMITLAALLLGPALSWGMSETFCAYQHQQLVQVNLTLLVHGSRTPWHIEASVVRATPRPERLIEQPAPAPGPVGGPISFPRAMIKQVHQGARVLGVLARVSARLMKRWLIKQIDILEPMGSD